MDLLLLGAGEVRSVSIAGIGDFYIRVISARELDSLEIVTAGRLFNVRGEMLARALCDAEGVRTYTDEDGERLGDIPGWIADKLFSVAADVNRISDTGDGSDLPEGVERIKPKQQSVEGMRGTMEALEAVGLAKKVESSA